MSQIEPQITCSVYIDNFETLDFANKGLEQVYYLVISQIELHNSTKLTF